MNKGKLLLLTLVHPDFLPPVYATAQSLRDLGYDIHILTFDSFVPSEYHLGNNISLELLGRHFSAGTFERISLRNKFTSRAKELTRNSTKAIIAFCPFSFQCGLKVKGNLPVIYSALEISDFKLNEFLRSPLSNYRNLQAIRHMKKADLITTPSIQRSAWLAGRCHLDVLPQTILNCAYFAEVDEQPYRDTYRKLVPPDFWDKKVVLYTGAVNDEHCILEAIQAFDIVNDTGSALVITGIKDTPYCEQVKKLAATAHSTARIKLLPYVTRLEMESLQANACIGLCLEKEVQTSIRSQLIAPNKTGEYLAKGLYVVGNSNEYMQLLRLNNVASLTPANDTNAIADTLTDALKTAEHGAQRETIKKFVSSFFCMQQQVRPIADFLSKY